MAEMLKDIPLNKNVFPIQKPKMKNNNNSVSPFL